MAEEDQSPLTFTLPDDFKAMVPEDVAHLLINDAAYVHYFGPILTALLADATNDGNAKTREEYTGIVLQKFSFWANMNLQYVQKLLPDMDLGLNVIAKRKDRPQAHISSPSATAVPETSLADVPGQQDEIPTGLDFGHDSDQADDQRATSTPPWVQTPPELGKSPILGNDIPIRESPTTSEKRLAADTPEAEPRQRKRSRGSRDVAASKLVNAGSKKTTSSTQRTKKQSNTKARTKKKPVSRPSAQSSDDGSDDNEENDDITSEHDDTAERVSNTEAAHTSASQEHVETREPQPEDDTRNETQSDDEDDDDIDAQQHAQVEVEKPQSGDKVATAAAKKKDGDEETKMKKAATQRGLIQSLRDKVFDSQGLARLKEVIEKAPIDFESAVVAPSSGLPPHLAYLTSAHQQFEQAANKSFWANFERIYSNIEFARAEASLTNEMHDNPYGEAAEMITEYAESQKVESGRGKGKKSTLKWRWILDHLYKATGMARDDPECVRLHNRATLDLREGQFLMSIHDHIGPVAFLMMGERPVSAFTKEFKYKEFGQRVKAFADAHPQLRHITNFVDQVLDEGKDVPATPSDSGVDDTVLDRYRQTFGSFEDSRIQAFGSHLRSIRNSRARGPGSRITAAEEVEDRDE